MAAAWSILQRRPTISTMSSTTSSVLANFSQAARPLHKAKAAPGHLDLSRNRLSLKSKKALKDVEYKNHTSGRWLKDDCAHLRARHLEFDFEALCARALRHCEGAQDIVHCEKREGSYNRVFLLTASNGKKVVARVPFPLAGPPRLTTHSEVATISYVRSRTKVPIPPILEWSDDPSNDIGSEYIIMEHCEGKQASSCWTEMKPSQHASFVRQIARMVKDVALLRFPAYGSIYFSDISYIPQGKKIPFADGYCIGPHIGPPAWPCHPNDIGLMLDRQSMRGPFPNLASYISGLLASGRDRIPSNADIIERANFFGTVGDHFSLLDACERIFPEMLQSSTFDNISQPMLFHYDLHRRNVFVSESDPTQITGIIDWQSTSVEPAFAYNAEAPDFTQAPSEPTPEGGLHGKSREETSEIRKKDVAFCSQIFELTLKGYVPTLFAARTADETMIRPILYCATSWRDSSTALRQQLIELSAAWTKLGFAGQCPYQPTEAEMLAHAKVHDDFETWQELHAQMMLMLGASEDGWVPPSQFDAATKMNSELYSMYLREAEQCDEKPLTMDQVKLLWPYDVQQ